jgi:hypothetical protein
MAAFLFANQKQVARLVLALLVLARDDKSLY